MDGVHESYHTRLCRHDDRVRSGSAPEVPDPFEGLARGDTGRREEHVGSPDQVVERKLPLGVCKTVLFEFLDLGALRRPHPSLHLPPKTFHYRRGENTFRGSSDADNGVQVAPSHPYGDRRGKVTLGPDLDTRARIADLVDEALVPVTIQDGDGNLRRLAAERLRYGLDVLRNGCIYVDGAP